MENILIEPFNISDLEIIANNLEEDFDNFWNYNILKNELEHSNSLYFVCKCNKKIIGFAGITIIIDTAEINNIVIKKSERGKGFSSLLLDKLIKSAKFNNCKKINLEVANTNKVAINLYKKFGFNQVGVRPKYYNGIDALLFTLDI